MSQYLKEMAQYPALWPSAAVGEPVDVTSAHNHALVVCFGPTFAGPVTLTVEQTGLDPNDHCLPDATGWTSMGEVQDCANGKEFVEFSVIFDAADPDDPAEPNTCCMIPFLPCNAAFIRVLADAGQDMTVSLLATRLKRSL